MAKKPEQSDTPHKQTETDRRSTKNQKSEKIAKVKPEDKELPARIPHMAFDSCLDSLENHKVDKQVEKKKP
jgi:hypothetical protein